MSLCIFGHVCILWEDTFSSLKLFKAASSSLLGLGLIWGNVWPMLLVINHKIFSIDSFFFQENVEWFFLFCSCFVLRQYFLCNHPGFSGSWSADYAGLELVKSSRLLKRLHTFHHDTLNIHLHILADLLVICSCLCQSCVCSFRKKNLFWSFSL